MSQKSPMPRRAFIERSARYPHGMKILAKTFGNPDPYELDTVNISFSGFLFASVEEMPFRINTLLEIDVDPKCKELKEPVNCVCKVMRFANEQKRSFPQFNYFYGVKIIEISTEHLRDWEEYLKTYNDPDESTKDEKKFLDSNPDSDSTKKD